MVEAPLPSGPLTPIVWNNPNRITEEARRLLQANAGLRSRIRAGRIADSYAAAHDWERAIAAYRKLLADEPANIVLLTKLITTYESAGRTREAVPYLAKLFAANPHDTELWVELAARQAWFGQDSGTRRHPAPNPRTCQGHRAIC